MTGKPQQCTHPGCAAKPVARRLCRNHYQQAWKAGKLGAHKKQTTRPRLRDRKICPPDHRHAEATTCYIQHQCRCDPCADHNAAREQRRKKDIAYGRYDSGLVDVTPVREHVLMLGEYGIGYKRVAQLAGFKSSTPVRSIIWGRQEPGPRNGELQKRVKRETAEKILAIQPVIENLAPKQPVPSTGTHRRVQALIARGWSMSQIATRADWGIANFFTMMQRPLIAAVTHLTIAALYEQLWDQEPPQSTRSERAAYTRSLRYAAARGWLPPLAWDDIDEDPAPDVPEQPEQGKGARILEDAEWLLDAGESPNQVAASLGKSPATLAKLAWRHDRADIASLFEVARKLAA